MFKLNINNYEFKKQVYSTFNVHIKISKVPEIKKFFKEYAVIEIKQLINESNYDEINELFNFPQSKIFKIEPIDIKQEFIELRRESLYSYISQDKFIDSGISFRKKKEKVLKSFIYENILNKGDFIAAEIEGREFNFMSLRRIFLEKFKEENLSNYFSFVTEDMIHEIIDREFIDEVYRLIDFENLISSINYRKYDIQITESGFTLTELDFYNTTNKIKAEYDISSNEILFTIFTKEYKSIEDEEKRATIDFNLRGLNPYIKRNITQRRFRREFTTARDLKILNNEKITEIIPHIRDIHDFITKKEEIKNRDLFLNIFFDFMFREE